MMRYLKNTGHSYCTLVEITLERSYSSYFKIRRSFLGNAILRCQTHKVRKGVVFLCHRAAAPCRAYVPLLCPFSFYYQEPRTIDHPSRVSTYFKRDVSVCLAFSKNGTSFFERAHREIFSSNAEIYLFLCQ